MVVGLDKKLHPVVEAMLEDYAASKGNERVALVNSAVEQLTALAATEGILTPFNFKVSIYHFLPCLAHNLHCRLLKTGSKTIARRPRPRPNPAMSRHTLGMLGMSAVLFRKP